MKLCDVKTDFGKPQGYKPCGAGKVLEDIQVTPLTHGSSGQVGKILNHKVKL